MHWSLRAPRSWARFFFVWLSLLVLERRESEAATLYVSPGAPIDGNALSAKSPSGDMCQTLANAKDGDSLWISEGTFTTAVTCHVQKRRLTIQGGYKADFSARDAFAQPTRFARAGKSSAAFLRIASGADDVTLDGLVFDGAVADAYQGSCPDCLVGSYDAQRHPPLVEVEGASRVRLKSIVWVNATGGALLAKSTGLLQVENASVVNSRPFAIKVAGACGYASPQCFELVLRQSSIVWTWRESNSESANGGSAIVVGAGTLARIEKSVIAYSDRVAVELDGALPQQVSASQLIVFDNVAGDFGQVQNGVLNAAPISSAGAEQGLQSLGELPGRMERLALPWDSEYLQRYLGRTRKLFYAGKLAWERAFMISPVADIGLKAPSGSRFTYDMAVAGGPTNGRVPEVREPKVDPPEDDPKKDPKSKNAKKKGRSGAKKKGGR
jgi:hypothetical protein